MLGPTQLAQLLPLTDINHKVAGEGVQAPPVQPGVTQAIPNATYANVAGQNKQGYALDFNNNGTFDRNDGVLAFDLNKDGKMTAREIEQSRTMLKVFSGDSDLNGDGNVNGLDIAWYVDLVVHGPAAYHAVFPALDPAELDRKIAELRVVENWLAMSLSMMQMSIKTMELQKASLEAMRAAGAPR